MTSLSRRRSSELCSVNHFTNRRSVFPSHHILQRSEQLAAVKLPRPQSAPPMFTRAESQDGTHTFSHYTHTHRKKYWHCENEREELKLWKCLNLNWLLVVTSLYSVCLVLVLFIFKLLLWDSKQVFVVGTEDSEQSHKNVETQIKDEVMERQSGKSVKKKGPRGVDRTWSPVAAVLPNTWQVLVGGRLNLDCWVSSISQFLETRLQQSKREGGVYEYAIKICRFIILRYLDCRRNSVLKLVKWNKSLSFHLLSSRGYFYNPTQSSSFCPRKIKCLARGKTTV